MIDFGHRLKLVRTKLKLTQKEFADKLGIRQSFYSVVESNKSFLPIQKLEVLFTELNVSPEWFFSPDEVNTEDIIGKQSSTGIEKEGVESFTKLFDLFFESQDELRQLKEIINEKDNQLKEKDEQLESLKKN